MEANNTSKLLEALKWLIDCGIIPQPKQVAVCMPCIKGEGFNPESEWCRKCGETRKKCEAIYVIWRLMKEDRACQNT